MLAHIYIVYTFPPINLSGNYGTLCKHKHRYPLPLPSNVEMATKHAQKSTHTDCISIIVLLLLLLLAATQNCVL